jgi:outer membrane lipoprotein-sorting protein
MRKTLFLFLFLFPALLVAQVDKEKKIITQMLTACDQMKGAKFLMASSERNKKGKMIYKEMLVKHQSHPSYTYLYCVQPDAGSEVLWREGIMNDEVMVNPNGFPYVTLKLHLQNTLLRKDGHHTVKDIGFDYIYTMVSHYQNSLGDKFYSYLKITDTIPWDGRKIIRVVFDYTDFTYIPYLVRKGENVTTISETNYINDCMILTANKEVDDFNDVKANQTIRIPNYIGRKIAFGIDLSTMLPLLQEVYDEKGLFERYELKSFIFNPKFEPDEFTPDFKDYHF